MAKNHTAAANKAFSQTIQRALSTLTKSQWQVLNHPDKGGAVRVYALLPEILKDVSSTKFYILTAFIVTETVNVGGGSKHERVRTREYIHQIASFDDKKALYEFHWHPEKIDRITLEPAKKESTDKQPFPHPHLHVRASDTRFVDLNKRHIPSGRVAFEDVARFLLSDCEVVAARADWETVLTEAKEEFDRRRTW